MPVVKIVSARTCVCKSVCVCGHESACIGVREGCALHTHVQGSVYMFPASSASGSNTALCPAAAEELDTGRLVDERSSGLHSAAQSCPLSIRFLLDVGGLPLLQKLQW